MQQRIIKNGTKLYIATSRNCTILIVLAYLCVALALGLSNWSWWLCSAIYLVMLWDSYGLLQTHSLRTHQLAVAAVWPDCEYWRYQLNTGKEYKGKLVKKRCYASSVLIILYVHSNYDSRYVLIPRDAMSQQHFRYLAMSVRSAQY